MRYLMFIIISILLYGCQAKEKRADYYHMYRGYKHNEPHAVDNLAISKMFELSRPYKCNHCHQKNEKLLGPSWKSIASVYDASDTARIAAIARYGNKGFWRWGYTHCMGDSNVGIYEALAMAKTLLGSTYLNNTQLLPEMKYEEERIVSKGQEIDQYAEEKMQRLEDEKRRTAAWGRAMSNVINSQKSDTTSRTSAERNSTSSGERSYSSQNSNSKGQSASGSVKSSVDSTARPDQFREQKNSEKSSRSRKETSNSKSDVNSSSSNTVSDSSKLPCIIGHGPNCELPKGNPFGNPGRERTKEELERDSDAQYQESQRRWEYEKANPPKPSPTPVGATK